MEHQMNCDEAILPVDIRRFLFSLRAFLPRIGQAALEDGIRIEAQSDTEHTVLLGDTGIGIDTGYAVPVPLLGDSKLTRTGLRVFTLQTVPGGRWHPDEEVDVTQIETESVAAALVCIASLLAEVETRGLPDFPSDMTDMTVVLEDAW